VKVDLPVHKSPCQDELFDGVDPFLFDNQLILLHGKHIDDTVCVDHPFGDTSKETVARKVIEPVHIKLARDKLVQEVFRVITGEDPDGRIQGSVILPVQLFHEQ